MMLSAMKREGVNHPIQGGSGDALKLAMVDIFYNNPFNTEESPDVLRILIQQHDELVVEVKQEYFEKARDYIVDRMEYWEQKFMKRVPAKADVEKEMKLYWEHK